MKSTKLGWMLFCLLLSFAGSPLAAQERPAASDSAYQQGFIEGTAAAQTAGTSVWTVGGFTGGLTLGPIGTALAYALADGSTSSLPDDVQSKVSRKGSDYSLGYQHAFTQRLVARRKQSALSGGVVGTALLVASSVGIYLQLK